MIVLVIIINFISLFIALYYSYSIGFSFGIIRLLKIFERSNEEIFNSNDEYLKRVWMTALKNSSPNLLKPSLINDIKYMIKMKKEFDSKEKK